VLRDEYEHWAESVTIAMAEAAAARASVVEMVFLTEDRTARVHAALRPNCTPKSVHRVLYDEVQAKKLAASDAETLAALLHQAGRGPVCTAAEFLEPSTRGIGRVGSP